jgi:hypothetical protein
MDRLAIPQVRRINGPARTCIEEGVVPLAWLASGKVGSHEQDPSHDPDVRISPRESSVPLEFAGCRAECVQVASVIGTCRAEDEHGDEQGKNWSAQEERLPHLLLVFCVDSRILRCHDWHFKGTPRP